MKFEDLKFVRLTIEKPENANSMVMLFNMIPRELFEQVKDREFDIDKIYQLSQVFLSNPLVQFYILVDKDNKIKGVFWANANILNNCFDVAIVSVDKEYQFNDAIKKTLEFINTLQKDATVRILTSRTAAYERAGFKKTKTMMEIKN